MNQEQEVQKRQEFKCILQDLARSQTELKDEIKLKEFINRLEQLYICPEHENPENYSVFRHYYSDIFIVLSEIANDKVEADSGESVSVDADIDILGQNLQIILMKYFRVTQLNRKKSEDVYDALRKLYDHASLDIARIHYSDGGDYRLSEAENIQKIRDTVSKLTKKVEDQEKAVEISRRKLEASEKDYIAILGIFSAVVLVFIADIAFSTSVLENMHLGSIYRIALVVLLIGFVIMNSMYALFMCIYKLTSIKNRIAVHSLIVSNAVFILLIFAVFAAWKYGIVENRNQDIQDALSDLSRYAEISSYIL